MRVRREREREAPRERERERHVCVRRVCAMETLKNKDVFNEIGKQEKTDALLRCAERHMTIFSSYFFFPQRGTYDTIFDEVDTLLRREERPLKEILNPGYVCVHTYAYMHKYTHTHAHTNTHTHTHTHTHAHTYVCMYM